MDYTMTFFPREYAFRFSNSLNQILDDFDRLHPLSHVPVSLCGGAVRDMIFGLKPNDYDFCSPCPSDYISPLIKAGLLTVENDKDYTYIHYMGTIISHIPVHIFTTDYVEGYAPSFFDFTINQVAMFRDGQVWADYQVWYDIDNKILRLNSERQPTTNICLRGVRFATKLGLSLTDDTLEQFRDRMGEPVDDFKALAGLIKIKNDGIAEECIPLLHKIGFTTTEDFEELLGYYQGLVDSGFAKTMDYENPYEEVGD